MTLVEKSPTQKIEDYNPEITKRMEGCMSVYFKLDRNSRKLKSPLIEQIESGLGIIVINKRFLFKGDKQLMQWIIETCKKEVKVHLEIALANFYNKPLSRNIKVSVK